MATSGAVANTIALLTKVPLGTVKFYAAALRKAGCLPTGGRGKSASRVSSEEAAALLLAVIMAESANKAPAAYADMSDMIAGAPFSSSGEIDDHFLWEDDTGFGLALDYFTLRDRSEPRRAGSIRGDTSSPLRFVASLLQGCVDQEVFPYDSGEDSFRPETFLDYDPIAKRFVFNMIVQDAGLFAFPTEDDEPEVYKLEMLFHLGEEEPLQTRPFLSTVKRFDLTGLTYLAAVLADATEWISIGEDAEAPLGKLGDGH